MSSDRVEKSYRTSTCRRSTAYRKIISIGVTLSDMGSCSACQRAHTPCVVLKGYSKCARCTKVNAKRCDGNFSELEFDTLERQKSVLRAQAAEKRAEVGRLAAAAAAAYTALAEAQKEEVRIQSELDNHTASQSRMLQQELEALDALDEAGGDADMGVSLGDNFFTFDSWVSPGEAH